MISFRDAAEWNARYDTAEFVWSTEPSGFLPLEVAGLTPGRALDVACGEGRNAVWLASQGWQVTGVDFSQVGLDKTSRRAAEEGVRLQLIRADVAHFRVDSNFELVVVSFLHLAQPERSAAFAMAARALAPGGTLLVVGHDLTNLTDGVGGPQSPEVLYTPEDVCEDLRAAGVDDLVIDRAERVERPVDVDGATVQAIDCLVRAHRPAPTGAP